jgi:hypothetical protein
MCYGAKHMGRKHARSNENTPRRLYLRTPCHEWNNGVVICLKTPEKGAVETICSGSKQCAPVEYTRHPTIPDQAMETHTFFLHVEPFYR